MSIEQSHSAYLQEQKDIDNAIFGCNLTLVGSAVVSLTGWLEPLTKIGGWEINPTTLFSAGVLVAVGALHAKSFNSKVLKIADQTAEEARQQVAAAKTPKEVQLAEENHQGVATFRKEIYQEHALAKKEFKKAKEWTAVALTGLVGASIVITNPPVLTIASLIIGLPTVFKATRALIKTSQHHEMSKIMLSDMIQYHRTVSSDSVSNEASNGNNQEITNQDIGNQEQINRPSRRMTP